MATTAISKETYRTDQSWIHEESGKLIPGVDVNFKVRIKRNAYDFQSSARLEAFDPGTNSWNQLFYLPGEAMASCQEIDGPHGKIDAISYTDRKLSPNQMNLIKADIKNLLNKTAALYQ